MTQDHTFIELYQRHHQMVTRIVRSILSTTFPDLAEDVAQTVWLKVWLEMGKPSWDAISSGELSHWLARVAKHKSMDARKKAINRHEVFGVIDNQAGWTDDDAPTPTLVTEAVAEAVWTLPARTRDVIKGFYWRNMSVAEMAEEYEMSKSTVRWHLWEGRRLVERYITSERRK